MLSAAVLAQDKKPAVVSEKNILGTWKGKADPELPDQVIKLQMDEGKIAGSMRVFEVRDNGSGSEVSNDKYLPLSNIVLEGNTLSFKIKLDDGRAIERKMKFTNDSEAVFESVRRIITNGDERTEKVPIKMVKEK
jgi:hypothetical protein